MRGLLAVALFVPLLAGCTTPVPDVRIEAFHAVYRAADGDKITVDFGQVVTYVAADGQLSQGYALDVTYEDLRMGHGQSILDSQLRLQRYTWCNGWSPDVDGCVHHQADWVIPGIAWPKVPHLGVGVNIAGPADANSTAVFDDTLAPLHVGPPEHRTVRTLYEGKGPLAPITPRALQPATARAPSGPGLVGGDQPAFGLSFTFDAALAFLRDDDEDAARILDAGGCVSDFMLDSFRSSSTGTLQALPILLQNETEESVAFTLTSPTEQARFHVGYGKVMPLGQAGFTGTLEDDDPTMTYPFDCGKRGPAIPLTDQYTLATSHYDGEPSFIHGGPGLGESKPFIRVAGEDGEVRIDGATGLLATWHAVPDGLDSR